jgi:hypothetical protein
VCPPRLSPEKAFIGDGDDLKEQAHRPSGLPLASAMPTGIRRGTQAKMPMNTGGGTKRGISAEAQSTVTGLQSDRTLVNVGE